jgi:hypothetical protein
MAETMPFVSTLFEAAQSGELPWPRYWGIHLGPHGLYRGYTMALDSFCITFPNYLSILPWINKYICKSVFLYTTN